jgi:hypothetical protein
MATAKDTIKSAVITNQTGSSWNNERASFSLCILSRYILFVYTSTNLFFLFFPFYLVSLGGVIRWPGCLQHSAGHAPAIKEPGHRSEFHQS